MLPKKKSLTQNSPSHTQIVSEACEKLKSASLNYQPKPSILKKVALVTAKKNLDNAYIQADTDSINGKIADIEHLHTSPNNTALHGNPSLKFLARTLSLPLDSKMDPVMP